VKIACCYPHTPAWPKFRWVHEALASLGHECVWVQNRDDLIEHEPHVDVCLFAHKSFPIRWPNLRDIWEKRQSLWAQWWFDLICTDPYSPPDEQPYIRQFRPHFDAMDVVFVKEREYLEAYRAAGVPAVYLDQGCPAGIKPIDYDAEIKWDVLVWGQSGPEYKQRRKDVEQLARAGYRVAWAGATKGVPKGVESLPWTHPDELHKLASHAACVLCVDRRTDIDGYWSDRIWLALGMGCLVVARYGKGFRLLEDLDDDDCPTIWDVYSDTGGYVDASVKWALEFSKDDRREAGEGCRKWVMEQHTIKHRCQQLVEILTAECATAKASCG